MGDGAEGLVDAQARIQDRMDELEQRRRASRRSAPRDPESARQLESLRLARADFERQASATAHPVRREQLTGAMAELDRRIAELQEKMG
ncbi:MAG: hypothetical protein EHM24_05740 [Acidobacteria bacterium]|nr:MAG: hypothetical protein EHM24_15095 [Acidobacteriota bacterium]RPJ74632.1 MAG: hypothetical protein EHM24_05740 [Acidobacteriota bacterium]